MLLLVVGSWLVGCLLGYLLVVGCLISLNFITPGPSSSRPLRMQLFNTEATSKSRGDSSVEVRRCKAWSQGPAPPVTQAENKLGWLGWLVITLLVSHLPTTTA